jgi:hypothetical protein
MTTKEAVMEEINMGRFPISLDNQKFHFEGQAGKPPIARQARGHAARLRRTCRRARLRMRARKFEFSCLPDIAYDFARRRGRIVVERQRYSNRVFPPARELCKKRGVLLAERSAVT